MVFRNSCLYYVADSMGTTSNEDSEEVSKKIESYSGVASSVHNYYRGSLQEVVQQISSTA